MAGPSLQIRLTQKLTLAPQLQQAIRLLQLSRLELREYVQEAVEANPLLDQEMPGDGPEADPAAGDEHGGDGDASDAAELESWDEGPWEEGAESELWNTDSGFSELLPEADIPDTSDDSLREHLLWQINLSHFNERDAAIATAIVFALDEDGLLGDSVEDVRLSLLPEWTVETAEVESVLRRVQRMEPVGVASRDPAECIRVQIEALSADTEGRDLARRLARDHLDLVAEHDIDAMQHETGAGREAIETALALIAELDPRPGARFDNRRDEYLVPDLYVQERDGEWVVTISPDNQPRLKLNRYYIGLLRQAGGEEKKYLDSRLQEARWLINSLELRNRTLMRVGQCIVERQRGFLEHGDIAMQPMVLRDIAETIDVHESTVSRATTRKYMLTPRGLYELKHFFSSHVSTLDGDQISATAVKAQLQMLLENEPPESPLSDQDLADLLRETGVDIARRTVAKYREKLGIGSSTERRKAYRRLQRRAASRA